MGFLERKMKSGKWAIAGQMQSSQLCHKKGLATVACAPIPNCTGAGRCLEVKRLCEQEIIGAVRVGREAELHAR
jgi:hypothetical protein